MRELRTGSTEANSAPITALRCNVSRCTELYLTISISSFFQKTCIHKTPILPYRTSTSIDIGAPSQALVSTITTASFVKLVGCCLACAPTKLDCKIMTTLKLNKQVDSQHQIWNSMNADTSIFLWNCREISTTIVRRLHDNKCSHNLMRVTHKVSDHHLHHKKQWWTALTTHWPLQHLKMGVDKSRKICPRFQANHSTKSASWVSVKFPEATGRVGHDVS